MLFRSDLNIAYFGNNTTAWQEGNILRANSGEFIRGENIFNFNKDAYILTQDQELWADILKFNRNTNKADLYNNIQLTDTVQNIIALGDRAEYISNPMYTKLTEDPAILMCSDEDGIKDTLYIKGDQFIYYSKMMSEIDSATIALSKERLELALSDPLKEADKKATQAANLDKQAPLNTPDKSTSLDSSSTSGLDTLNLPAQIDSLTIQADSLSLALQIDTLTVQTDTLSLAPQVDTTSVVFMDGYHNIKFRSEERRVGKECRL